MREPDPEFVHFIEKVVPSWCEAQIEEHRAAARLRPYLLMITYDLQQEMMDIHPATHPARREALLKEHFREELNYVLNIDDILPASIDNTFGGVLRDGSVLAGLGIAPYDPRPSATIARLNSVFDRRRAQR